MTWWNCGRSTSNAALTHSTLVGAIALAWLLLFSASTATAMGGYTRRGEGRSRAPAVAQASSQSTQAATAACSDGDGDGYGSPGNSECSKGSAADCNDGNASIFPGATERRTALAPVMLIDDDNQCPEGAGLADPCRTGEVETVLRFQDIVISFVVDRDGSGTFDTGSLDAIPQCALSNLDDASPGQSMESSECLLWRLCMVVDTNFAFEVKKVNVPILGDRERIGFKFGGIDVDASRGLMCDGELNVPEIDFFNVQAGNTPILAALATKLRENTPKFDSIGLDLGGNVRFDRDRIVAIETQHPSVDDGFQDYIGLTGSIVASTPEP